MVSCQRGASGAMEVICIRLTPSYDHAPLRQEIFKNFRQEITFTSSVGDVDNFRARNMGKRGGSYHVHVNGKVDC